MSKKKRIGDLTPEPIYFPSNKHRTLVVKPIVTNVNYKEDTMGRYQQNDNLMCSQMVVFLFSTSSVSSTTLTQCLTNVCCNGPALSEFWASISCRIVTQQTPNMYMTLVQRRPNVLVQHCTNVIQMCCVYSHVVIPWHTAGFFGRRHFSFHPVLKTLGETRRCCLGF